MQDSELKNWVSPTLAELDVSATLGGGALDPTEVRLAQQNGIEPDDPDLAPFS